MKKMWDEKDLKTVLQYTNDVKKQKETFRRAFIEPKRKNFVLDSFKEIINKDFMQYLDVVCDFYADADEKTKAELYQWTVENSHLETIEEAKRELEYFYYLRSTIKYLNKYLNEYTIETMIDLLNENNPDVVENIAHCLLARYYKEKKLHKSDYMEKNEEGKMMYKIIEAGFHLDYPFLLDIALFFKKQDELEEKMQQDKKVSKILTKANKKINQLLQNKDYPYEEKKKALEQVKEQTFQKILVFDNDRYSNQLIALQETIDNYYYQLGTQQENEQSEVIERHEDIQELKIEDLQVIENFYNLNHLYFKKTKLSEELIAYPFVIEFYQTYNETIYMSDNEEKIKKLEELISDIKESGLKNQEILRRLLSVAQKNIEDCINSESVETKIEEQPPITLENPGEVIKIGKFMVYKESVEDNPVNIQKVIDLLNEEDRSQVEWLKSLIYQVGFDKVHGYLLKCPNIHIYDLQMIMRLDRSLRFEYQRVLEDIEMYFRSSLTYFLSNKYDQKYLIEDTNQYFYKRGYLMGNLFEEYQEHFDQVKLLRDRIDDEMINNNLQVIDEYKRYKYALPFSTAAGIMTFGWIINMFENLNYYDRSEYLREYFYQISPQTFYCWMMSLSNLRNRCAHYQSLYRLSSLKELRPIMTKDIDGNACDDSLKHSSLFYYTVVMARLSPSISNIEDFIDNVGILFRKANRESDVFDASVDYSFPKNWRSLLENEKSTKINFNH